MKKMLFTLVTMLTIAVSANAMSYEQARREALFLTDKMAYELNLTDAQYEAAYEINLDYLMGVTSQDDVFGLYWERRNLDISYILYSWQWDLFRAATYFYRPLYWEAGYWHFGIYARYPHRDYFYFGRPHFYVSYRGGHSWRHNGGRSYYEGRHDHFRPHRTRDEHTGMRNGWDRGDYRGNNGRSSNGRSSTRVTESNDRITRDIRNERETIGRDNRSNGTIGRDSRSNSTFGSPRQSTAVGRQSTDIERQTTTREIHTERGSINRNTDISRSNAGTTNSSSSRSSGSFSRSNSGSMRSNSGSIGSNSSSMRSSSGSMRSSSGSMRSSGGSFSAPSRSSGNSSSPRGNGGGSRSGGRR